MKFVVYFLVATIILMVVWNVVQQRQIGALDEQCLAVEAEIERQKIEIRFLNDVDVAIYERLPGSASGAAAGLVEHSHGQ